MKRISMLYLIKQNFKGTPFRVFAIGICTFVLIGFLYTTTMLVQAVNESLKVGIARFGADLLVVPKGMEIQAQQSLLMGVAATCYMSKDIEQKIAKISGVEATSAQLFIKSLEGAACCSQGKVLLVGYDPETDFTITPWLKNRNKAPLGKSEIIIGADIAGNVDDSIKFYGQKFTIGGKLEPTGMGTDNSVFIPISEVHRMIAESEERAMSPLQILNDQISAVLIKVAYEKSSWDKTWWDHSWKVTYDIKDHIPGIDVVHISNLTKYTKRQLSGVVYSSYLTSIATWFITVILIALIYTLIINERRREIGLFRAIGANRFYIFKLVVLEATIITLLGGILGILFGSCVMFSFQKLISVTLEVPFLWPSMQTNIILISICLFVAALTGVIAVLYPAYSIIKIDPYDAIRRE